MNTTLAGWLVLIFLVLPIGGGMVYLNLFSGRRRH